MIALNNDDKLRADASVANKIDYTVHGIVNDAPALLSDGQMAAAEADIYTSPASSTMVTAIICVNTHTVAVTCNIYLRPSGGVSRKIIPKDTEIGIGQAMIFDGSRVSLFGAGGDVVTLGTGSAVIGKLAANSGVDIGDVDIKSQPADTFAAEDAALGKGVLLQGDDGTDRKNVTVDASGNIQVDIVGALPAGSAAIGKLAANSGVDIGDVDIASQPADTFVAEDGALGKGILLQGDDGTDRKNVLVDTAGHLQVDVLSGGGSNDSVEAEGSVAAKGTQISLDDGVDSHYAQANAAGDLKVTLDSEAVVLGAGSAAVGKLTANSGVDIGDVDVLSLPALPAGTNAIGSVKPSGKLQGTWVSIVVNISTATTTELKAAVAGHTYTVIGIVLTVAAENNLTWKSNTTAVSGPMDFGASGEPHGWTVNLWPGGLKFTTGEAVKLTTTTTGQVSGFICILDES